METPLRRIRDETAISDLYHENSKIRRGDPELPTRILAATILSHTLTASDEPCKRYDISRTIKLPESTRRAGPSFDGVVLSRRSRRDFGGESVNIAALSKILHFAGGITGYLRGEVGRSQTIRSCPSAGALYPCEIYVAAVHVAEVPSGVYHYNPIDDRLENLVLISASSLGCALSRITYIDELVNCAFAAIVSIIPARNRFKYGERSYRFSLIEVGHIAQNLLLTATALGLPALPIGGFVDDELDDLIGVDGVEELGIYLVAVGCPARRRKDDRRVSRHVAPPSEPRLPIRGERAAP